MNKQCYQIIFNKKRGQMMVVAENTVREGKSTADGETGFNGAATTSSRRGFKLLSFSLMLALGSAVILSPIADARVVADPNAPGNQRPTILPSANGTPQVNIQKPTKGGVSMNQYQQFDVDKKGVILNNSRKNTQTQLGGMVQANPWLAGGSAKVIVNQVNSRNPSQLNGYVEVAGQKADVIIANQAGLSINGGGFINAPRVTLTTGNPIIKDGLVAGYAVQGGAVNIHGEGLDVRDANYTRILTAAANINGGVWGQNVDVVAGHYDLDQNDKISTTAADPSAPAFAIDTGALGGMYAGKITLVSTDRGRGIQHKGQLFASAGGVSLSADGQLSNSGVINSNGKGDNVAIQATSVHNSGTVSSQHNQSIQTQDLTNTGLLASAQELNVQATDIINDKGTFSAGRLDLSAQTLSNQKGTLVQTGRQSLAIEAGHLKNHDQGLLGYTPVVDKPTEPTEGNGSGNEPNPEPKPKPDDGSTAPSTGAGGGQIETAPTVPVTLATGRINVTNQLDNTGQITANGGVDLDTKSGLSNQATLNLNQLKVAGAALDNRGDTLTAQAIDVATADIWNQNSTIQAEKYLSLNSQRLSNQKGEILVGERGDITADALANNDQGLIASVGDLALTVTDLDNQTGAILVGQDLSLKGQTLNNQKGTIEANQAHLALTTLDNQEGGAIRVNEVLTIEAKDRLNNQQGQISSAKTLNIHDAQAKTLIIDNQDGQILAGKAATLQAKSLSGDGKVASAQDLTLMLKDDFTANTAIEAGQDLSISTEGHLTNNSKIGAGNQLTLNSQSLTNTATGQIEAQNLLHWTGDALTNRGLINSNGLTALSATGKIDNIGTGQIYGNDVAIAADTLHNREEISPSETTPKAAVIAAREHLSIGAKNIINQEDGLLFSGNTLAIGGALDDQHRVTGQADWLRNGSARIESLGDMDLSVTKLENKNDHFAVEEYLDDTRKILEHAVAGSGERMTGGQFKWERKKNIKYIRADGTVVTARNWDIWDYTEYEYKERITENRPGEVIVGGNLNASGQDWLNDNSKIIVGGDLVGDIAGSIKNESYLGKGRIETDGVYKYSWFRPGSTFRPDGRYDDVSAYTSLGNKPTVATRTFSHDFETPVAQVIPNANNVNHRPASMNEAQTTQISGVDNNEKVQVKTLAEGNTSLSNSSLFSVNPNSKDYLIETDPKFANYKQWLGSDYMIKMMGANPDDMHKRLGDGYYEQRLLNEQVAKLTGQRYLPGYSNDEAQFKALMDAGIQYAQTFNVAPGVALSAEQMKQLTSDMVWLVNERVTLPDGTETTALVPKLYVRANQSELSIDGALISAKSLQLKTDAFENQGLIKVQDGLSIGARNIDNLSGRISGGQVQLHATDTFSNIGGVVVAADELNVQARDINIASSTQKNGQGKVSNETLDRIASLAVTNANGSDGKLTVYAQNELNLNAAHIDNAGTGATVLAGEQGVNIGTVNVAQREHIYQDSHNYRTESNEQEVGSSINGKGDVTIYSGQDLNIRQSDINSDQGTTTLQGQNVTIREGRAKTNLEELHLVKSKDVLSKSSQETYDYVNDNTAVGSNITGNKVVVNASKDLTIRGSNVVSDQGTMLVGENVTIIAAQNTSQEQHDRIEKESGLMGSGGFGFTVGKRESTLEQDGVSTTHSGSMVGSLNGDTAIIAGNHYTQIGSDVSAPKGDVLIQGQTIDVLAAVDTYANDTKETYKQSGLTVAVSAPAVNAALQANNAVKGVEKVGKSKSDRVNTMAAINAGVGVYDTYAGGKDAIKDMQKDPSKVSASITVGSSKSESETHTKGTEVVGSQVKAGGNTTLIATGAGQDSVINVVGSEVAGEQGTNLIAEGNINLLAAAQDHSERSSNKSSGWNAGVAIAYENGKGTLGVTAGGHLGKGYGNGDDVAYVNTKVGSDTGQTTLISGETLNLIGAQVKGKGVAIDAKELNIESLQDQAKFDSKQKHISGQITAGTGVSGSASYSKSKINADYASVNEQSGILAGDDGYQINIQGNTDLKGGLITSTQLAENANKNQLMTGTLTSSDIDNHAEYKGSSVGVGMSGVSNGGWDGKAVDKDGNATSTASSSQGYGSDKGSDSSTTHSGINTGNIIITDAEGQQALTGKSVQETLDQIKTDVTTDTAAANSGHIGNNFDKNKVQKELDLQREVMEEFSKNTQRAKNLINTKQQELLDEVEKLQAKDKNDPRIAELLNEAKNWQTGGLLLDSVAGVLSGPNTNGAIGTIANAGKPWLASEIGQYFKQESNKDKTTAQVLAHTILGGAIAAATGNDALSGALAAGGAEALAPTLTHFLYGKKPDELSADEKQTISSIISLGGAGVGALVGGSGSDAVSGGQLAGNAVDNNYLTQKNWNDYKKRVDECDDFRCVTKAQKDLYEISRLKNDELTSACGVNLDIAKCNRLIIEADAAKKITQKELDAFGDQNPKKPLPTFVQYYDVPWASNPNVHYWAASVDLPAFLGLGSGGSIVVNNVTNEVFIGYSVSKGTDNKAGFNAIAGIINNLSSFEKARLGITINDTLNGKSTGGQGCYWACAGVNKTVGADGPNRVSFEFGVGTPGASIGDTVLYPIGNILNFNRGNNVK